MIELVAQTVCFAICVGSSLSLFLEADLQLFELGLQVLQCVELCPQPLVLLVQHVLLSLLPVDLHIQLAYLLSESRHL